MDLRDGTLDDSRRSVFLPRLLPSDTTDLGDLEDLEDLGIIMDQEVLITRITLLLLLLRHHHLLRSVVTIILPLSLLPRLPHSVDILLRHRLLLDISLAMGNIIILRE